MIQVKVSDLYQFSGCEEDPLNNPRQEAVFNFADFDLLWSYTSGCTTFAQAKKEAVRHYRISQGTAFGIIYLQQAKVYKAQ